MNIFDIKPDTPFEKMAFKRGSVDTVTGTCPNCGHRFTSPSSEISDDGIGKHICEKCGYVIPYMVGLDYMEYVSDRIEAKYKEVEE